MNAIAGSGRRDDATSLDWIRNVVEERGPVFDEAADIAIDVDKRIGHVRVDGLIETSGKPIVNPVTGAEHRVRIDLHDGFEYTLAEIGSSTFSSKGPVQMTFEDRYAQFAHIHLNNHGIVR